MSATRGGHHAVSWGYNVTRTDFQPMSRVTIGGVEVTPGATWNYPRHATIRAHARCVSVRPDRFAGVVTMGTVTILETEAMETTQPFDAAQAALDALAHALARVVASQ
jgi:hypothetical protein